MRSADAIEHSANAARGSLAKAVASDSPLLRSALSGKELASLLRIVVTASNVGKLAAVPSLWKLFLQAQVTEAKSASITAFRQRMKAHHRPTPLPTATFAELAGAEADVAAKMFQDLLFGLHNDFVTSNRKLLVGEVESAVKAEQQAHRLSVKAYIEQTQDNIERSFDDYMKALPIPTPSRHLAESALAEAEKAQQGLKKLR